MASASFLCSPNNLKTQPSIDASSTNAMAMITDHTSAKMVRLRLVCFFQLNWCNNQFTMASASFPCSPNNLTTPPPIDASSTNAMVLVSGHASTVSMRNKWGDCDTCFFQLNWCNNQLTMASQSSTSSPNNPTTRLPIDAPTNSTIRLSNRCISCN